MIHLRSHHRYVNTYLTFYYEYAPHLLPYKKLSTDKKRVKRAKRKNH